MKNKKIPIVINLVKLSKNQYAIAEPETADTNTQVKQAPPTANAANQPAQSNNNANSSSNKKAFPKQPSSQSNNNTNPSQNSQLKAFDQTANASNNASVPPINQSSTQAGYQPSSSGLSSAQNHGNHQPLLQSQKSINPTSAPSNIVPPAVIIRGEENAKDIFPYTGFAGDRQLSQQHQAQQSLTNIADPSKAGGAGGASLGGATGTGGSDRPQKKYQVVIPSCSHWFDLEKVHQIEKESLPEFFQGKPSKTPEIYKKYRNFIVQLYRANPRVHLTATACRRNLAGDVCAILRLHAFLEDWGIINFNCDPKLTPQSVLLFKPSQAAQAMYKYSDQTKRLDLLDQDRERFNEGSEGDLVFNSVKVLSKNQRPLCDFCGVKCGLVWFQSRVSLESQMPNMVLCIKCFSEGNYPSFLSDSDFDKTDLVHKLSCNDPGKISAKKPWTHEETLLLLEKIEKHRDNWDEIAKEIQQTGRTREEIILHFLRLPLKSVSQVRVFDSEEETAGLSDRQPYEQAIEDEPTIFSDASNPLMQHIAIFKSLLDKSKQKHQTIKAVPRGIVAVNAATASSQLEVQVVQKEPAAIDEGIPVVKSENNLAIGDDAAKVEGVVESAAAATITGEVARQTTAMEIEDTEADVAVTATVAGLKVEHDANVAVATKQQQQHSSSSSTTLALPRLGLVEEISESTEEDLLSIERETKRRARMLQEHEELKIKKLVQSLIFCQLQKLESKLNYLEEYEKLIWYERNQLDVTQSYHVAETVSLTYRRNEFTKEFSRQYAEHHKRQEAVASGNAAAAVAGTQPPLQAQQQQTSPVIAVPPIVQQHQPVVAPVHQVQQQQMAAQNYPVNQQNGQFHAQQSHVENAVNQNTHESQQPNVNVHDHHHLQHQLHQQQQQPQIPSELQHYDYENSNNHQGEGAPLQQQPPIEFQNLQPQQQPQYEAYAQPLQQQQQAYEQQEQAMN